jgi:glutathione synthase/RimK-type ligase-like ATP-grasp enzyme
MAERKKVLILFGKRTWDDDIPFKKKPQYKFCYECLFSMAEKEGLEIFRASYQWFDWNRGVFKNAWAFSNGEWKRVHDIIPDVIYDKTKHNASSQLAREKLAKMFEIFNDPDFTLLLSSKLYASLLFPEYMKKNALVRNKKDFSDVINNVKTSKIVLKPMNGSGGDGVKILDKKELDFEMVDYPAIAQEFIDSSQGIEGIVQGTHDLRVVVAQDEIVYAYTRTPKEGSLLANLAQGGSMKIVPLENLPESVVRIVSAIREKLAVFGNSVYTIDFMFDENQSPWVIELNTMPGMFFAPGQEEWMDKMYSKLVSIFKGI